VSWQHVMQNHEPMLMKATFKVRKLVGNLKLLQPICELLCILHRRCHEHACL
jgi:hypothetical protein